MVFVLTGRSSRSRIEGGGEVGRVGIVLLAVLLSMITMVCAQEPGDADGDGRLTIGDVYWLMQLNEPAPGSVDALRVYPCYPHWLEEQFPQTPPRTMAAWLYLEVLRRSFSDSLPLWIADIWPDSVAAGEPLPHDERVVVELHGVRAPGGQVDEYSVFIDLTTDVPLRAFSLVFESAEDVVGWAGTHDVVRSAWDSLQYSGRESFSEGNLEAQINLSTYLLTNGRYALHYGLCCPDSSGVSPEEINPSGQDGYRRSIGGRVRLPRGTARGTYPLRLASEACQVLLRDGTVVAPIVVSDADLVVERDVEVGDDGSIPPLRFDVEERRVLGNVEFRMTEAAGLPGETVKVRLQMRTEVPLNSIYYWVTWSGQDLLCAREVNGEDDAVVLLRNPDTGEEYWRLRESICAQSVFGHPRRIYGTFMLPGAGVSSSTPGTPLDYFRPLEEWLDLVEVELMISPCARGGTLIPFEFHLWDPEHRFDRPNRVTQFAPYATQWCYNRDETTPPPPPDNVLWRYDISYIPGQVRVLGEEPACDDPPPDLGVRWVVGEAAGMPGEIVEVPVYASSDEPVSALRLAVHSDPAAVSVDAFEVAVESVATGEIHDRVAERGSWIDLLECEGQQPCTGGIPSVTGLLDTPPEYSVVDIIISPGQLEVLDYPGPALIEIGRLRARIQEDFTGAEIPLRVATEPLPIDFPVGQPETGAFMRFPDIGVFVPATEVEDGLIRVTGNNRSFRRGDGNSDGNIDLSDALTTLNFLFLGGPRPGCMDAADADDSGRLELTDAVFHLNALFLGAGRVPEPWPACGVDPTGDTLGCGSSDC